MTFTIIQYFLFALLGGCFFSPVGGLFYAYEQHNAEIETRMMVEDLSKALKEAQMEEATMEIEDVEYDEVEEPYEIIDGTSEVVYHVDDTDVVNIPDIFPEFKGGLDSLYVFLGKNLIYPKEALEKDISGIIYVQFIIDKEGNIRNEKIIRGIGAGCDEEALRVVRIMPQWEPGKNNGIPVNVNYTLPIKFELK